MNQALKTSSKTAVSPTENAHFFIIYPPGLEEAGLVELRIKYALLAPASELVIKEVIPGGLLIECPLHLGLKLNLVLKTATRILLRLLEFKGRDFPKLYQKISKFNWAPWMIGQTPEVECSSKNSRLFDSRKIEKSIGDGVNEFYRRNPVKKKYLERFALTEKKNLPKLYFRAEDDLVTISLDTTGERLHLRGERPAAGLAPIRENLASLLLTDLLSDALENVTLIDPMCGSGTFLLEAKNYFQMSNERDFAFFHLPLVIEAHALFINFPWPSMQLVKQTVGFDISRDVIAQAKKNDSEGDFRTEDLMSKTSYQFENPVVIVNPPYGIRVGENINLDFFLRTIRAVKNKFSPSIAGFIIPADYKIYSNEEWTVKKTRAFKNGGIEVVFTILTFT
jgi:putative N6-adenine-specific DNA methylase